jgi:hypothetical protein
MYDIVYVGPPTDEWYKLKRKYRTAKIVDSAEKAKLVAFTKMIWIVYPDTIICDDFDFSYSVPNWDLQYHHVFKNGDFFDGIALLSKKNFPSKNEINYRFFIEKKEIDIVASYPKPYDVIFISYNESNADKNFELLKQKVPNAKRIHGVKGIHRAHVAAAKLASTDMFYVVDGDAQICNEFMFDYYIPQYDTNAKNTVYVWKSKNPINNLVYGYGGVKLLPRERTVNMDTSSTDMTTSIGSFFKPMSNISNLTAFNTDEFNTWKSAFRECAKLASKTIQGQIDEETEQRLNTWTTVGHDRKFGEYAIRGARAGMEFGLSRGNDIFLINDFDWLEKKFTEDFKYE